MNEYEYKYKLQKAGFIKNMFLLTVMVIAIIYTNSLWWLFLLLGYGWFEDNEKEDKKIVGMEKSEL